MIKGIDISVYQQKVDFEKVKKSGIEFVIIRGAIGTRKDTMFESHYSNAKNAGLKVGCYYYTFAKNVAEAKGEADVFLSCIKGKQFEYPIYFDIEDPSLQNLGKQTLTDIVLTWCGKVQSAGYYVGILTGFLTALTSNALKVSINGSLIGFPFRNGIILSVDSGSTDLQGLTATMVILTATILTGTTKRQ